MQKRKEMWLSRISFLLLATAVCVVSELGQAAAQPSKSCRVFVHFVLVNYCTTSLRKREREREREREGGGERERERERGREYNVSWV